MLSTSIHSLGRRWHCIRPSWASLPVVAAATRTISEISLQAQNALPLATWKNPARGIMMPRPFHSWTMMTPLRCLSTSTSMRPNGAVNEDNEDDNDDDSHFQRRPPFSNVTPKFAVVRHEAAYQTAMNGLHGQQLALALLEGEGKDEPDFDPFLEEELEEARLLAEAQDRKQGKGNAAAANANDGDQLDDNEDDIDSTTTDSVVAADPSSSPLYQHKLNRKKYHNDGSLRRNASEKAILRAGSPAGGMVAIIAMAGTQFKVTTDDVVIVNLLKPVSKYAVGSIQTLRNEQVLLVTSSALTLVGMPYVQGAEVDILIEEITQDAKLVIFKKRRRKNSKRKTGFRRDVTMLRILDIRFPPPYDAHDHAPRPDPAPLIPK